MEVDENIFTYNGKAEHEIFFIYTAGFADKSAYQKELMGNLDDKGQPFHLVWASVKDISARNIKVYPGSLLSILAKMIDDRTGM